MQDDYLIEDYHLIKNGSLNDIDDKIEELNNLKHYFDKHGNFKKVLDLSKRISTLEVYFYSRKYDLTIEEAMEYNSMRKAIITINCKVDY